jgi:hypothetical protein
MPLGLKVEEVPQVSPEDPGDFATTALWGEGDQVLRVPIPARLGQTLLAVLSAEVNRLGSHLGPSERLGRAHSQATVSEMRTAPEDGGRVLVRLKAGDVPVIDFVLLDFDARALSRQLAAAAEMGASPRRRH